MDTERIKHRLYVYWLRAKGAVRQLLGLVGIGIICFAGYRVWEIHQETRFVLATAPQNRELFTQMIYTEIAMIIVGLGLIWIAAHRRSGKY